jgi:hypothetical protein
MKTRSDDALRPAHDFIPRISCTAPACNVNRINSAGSTGLHAQIAQTSDKYYTSTRKTSYQRGPEAPRAHRGKNYLPLQNLHISLTDAVIHAYTSPCCIHRLWYNGIRHARLYVTCHTCTTPHPKLHISYTSLWFHYVFTATYMYRPICRARFEFSMLLNQC